MKIFKWDYATKSAGAILTNGNLTLGGASGLVKANYPIPDGKTYCEFKMTVSGSFSFGIIGENYVSSGERYLEYGTGSFIRFSSWNGDINKTGVITNYASYLVVNDVLGMYIDKTNNSVGFTINGVDKGIASNALNTFGTNWYVAMSVDGVAGSVTINFGEKPFIYAPPTGYSRMQETIACTSLQGMKIGDYIKCRYTAISNTIGTFSELGTTTANEILTTGEATVDGSFNLIKADNGLLVADRNVQHSISINTLNAGGMLEGKEVNVSLLVPIMSSSNSGSISISASSNYPSYNPWEAFGSTNATEGDCWLANSGDGYGGWIQVDFGVSNNKKIVRYSIRSRNYGTTNCPASWILKASNDLTNWDTLDTRTGKSYPADTVEFFNINNNNSYRYYRVVLNDINYNGSYIGFGKIQFFSEVNGVLIRSLGGGSSYADASGNASSTDKGYGMFPPINEWDSYIVNSTLNETIIAGNNNVWNFSPLLTMTTDTPSLALGANTDRICRGYETVKNMLMLSTSTTSASYGFRPVLQYNESTSKANNLFY